MTTRAVQIFIEENPFAIDLFNFIFGALNTAKGRITNRVQSYFNEEIGFAVLYMQFVSRDSVRDALKAIHIRTTDDALHVTRKLCRLRRKKNPDKILQVFFECCAIIIEVYLYCTRGINLPIETRMIFLSWNFVFNRRRMREILSIGGWDEVRAYARMKLCNKVTLIDCQLDLLEYPFENFITCQSFDSESEMIAVDFEESFACITENRELEVDLRERYRQSKATMRMKRVEDRLIAKNLMGTASAEAIMASQTTIAMRSGRKPTDETVDWANDISPYNSSEEEDYEETGISPTVSELCTKMSDAQIASFAERRKKKQKKRKKKPSRKQSSETEQAPLNPSPEAESPPKQDVPQTFASSCRPLKVPVRSPATSPTKTDTPAEISVAKEVSPRQPLKKVPVQSLADSPTRTENPGDFSATKEVSPRQTLKVPVPSPATSPAKTDTPGEISAAKKVSPRQPKTGKKDGKKK